MQHIIDTWNSLPAKPNDFSIVSPGLLVLLQAQTYHSFYGVLCINAYSVSAVRPWLVTLACLLLTAIVL